MEQNKHSLAWQVLDDVSTTLDAQAYPATYSLVTHLKVLSENSYTSEGRMNPDDVALAMVTTMSYMEQKLNAISERLDELRPGGEDNAAPHEPGSK